MFKKKSLFFSIALLALAFQARGAEDVDEIRSRMLKEHSFTRNEYSFVYQHIHHGTGPLLGNAEMGGKPIRTGLGYARGRHSMLWFASFWNDPGGRKGFGGPNLYYVGTKGRDITEFTRHLNIANGVLTSKGKYKGGQSYEAKLYFSHANRHLMVVEMKNTSEKDALVDLNLDRGDYNCQRDGDHIVKGRIKDEFKDRRGKTFKPYTRMAWAVHVDKKLQADRDRFTLKPGEAVTMRFSFAVHWYGEDIEKDALAALELKKDSKQLFKENEKAWDEQWKQTAVVVLPHKEHEKLFYRCVYWMLSTSGSKKFLPGEVMFSTNCWHMHAFTYGAGGWPVYAYTYIGLPDHARRMLGWHYKPEAFVANAKRYMPDGKENPDAWSFAHELSTDGHEIASFKGVPWGSQRHIEAFAAGFFHRYHEYYPDPEFKKERVWPVFRGTAEFWRSIAKYDEKYKGYLLPKLLSVSENCVEHSVLDAVMAAKYCLMMASRYADEMGVDKELSEKWKKLDKELYVPQNEKIFLQYPGLTGAAKNKLGGGGDYFGYRSPIYLGFPVDELVPSLDKEKVDRTLDDAWITSGKGHHMITFIASWYALTDLYHGRGDHALEIMQRNLDCMPATLAENLPSSGHRPNPYYLDSIAGYTILPMKMVLQSYDDTIRIFPALPTDWKDVEFYNVPAEEGLRVSGEMKKGKVVYIDFKKDGKSLLRLKKNKVVTINKSKGKIKLKAK